MRSNRKVRFVKAQTPPFQAKVTVRADLADQIWAQARAEALLMEQIRSQVGGRVGNLAILKKAGVYTVRHDADYGLQVHEIDAPNGVRFLSVEEVPRWWEAVDTLEMRSVPTGNGLVMSLVPTVPLDVWRSASWPDRPHP